MMNSNSEMTMNPDHYHDDSVSAVISNTDSYSDKTATKVITKNDLWKIGFRGLLMEGNFNFNRMQAGGFCYSISPALKKIHKNPEDLKE